MRTTLSELGTSLSRNKSMTISLVVTMTVSLLLAALGLLIQSQADRTEKYFGDRLQLQVNLCTKNSPSATCLGGVATEDQKSAVKEALSTNPEVKSFDVRTPAANYEQARELLGQTDTGKKQLETLGPSAFPESYFVTLKDPQEFDGVVSQVSGMDGVGNVNSLRKLLGPLFEILEKMQLAAHRHLAAAHRRGDPAGLQHHPHDGVRAPPRDRHHAPRRCVQLAHPAAVRARVDAGRPHLRRAGGARARPSSCTSSSTATCATPWARSPPGCDGRSRSW